MWGSKKRESGDVVDHRPQKTPVYMIGILVYQYIDTCIDTRLSIKKSGGDQGDWEEKNTIPAEVGPSEHRTCDD